MNSLKIQVSGLMILVSHLLGVTMLQAADTHPPRQWIATLDSVDQMKASFPHRAIEMTFDIPFKNTPSKGHLHIFTSATQTGVFLLSALTLPFINEKILNEKNYKTAFETYLVPHVFYSPQQFQRHQTFSCSHSLFKGRKALLFQYSYYDKQKKLLKGLSTVRGNTLYMLFYLTPQMQFNETDFQYFIESFDLWNKKTLF